MIVFTVLTIGLIGSVFLNVVLAYMIRNALVKIDIYEEKIQKYYNGTVAILAYARDLDRREMFESDDEVGKLFQQLMLIIGELRTLIYEPEEEEEEFILDARNPRRNYPI